jgi:hypothetical protein
VPHRPHVPTEFWDNATLRPFTGLHDRLSYAFVDYSVRGVSKRFCALARLKINEIMQAMFDTALNAGTKRKIILSDFIMKCSALSLLFLWRDIKRLKAKA